MLHGGNHGGLRLAAAAVGFDKYAHGAGGGAHGAGIGYVGMGIEGVGDIGGAGACGGVFFGVQLHAAAQGFIGFPNGFCRWIGFGLGGSDELALKAGARGDVV